MPLLVEVGECRWNNSPHCGTFYCTLFFCTEAGLSAEFQKHKADCFPIKAGWRCTVLMGGSWRSHLPGEWDIMYWCECPDGQGCVDLCKQWHLKGARCHVWHSTSRLKLPREKKGVGRQCRSQKILSPFLEILNFRSKKIFSALKATENKVRWPRTCRTGLCLWEYCLKALYSKTWAKFLFLKNELVLFLLQD